MGSPELSSWVHRLASWFGTKRDCEELQRVARERELLIERLEASERAFRAAFEQAAAGIAHVEPTQGTFVRLNRRYCELLGYEAGALIGRSAADVTHPDDVAAEAEGVAKLLSGALATFEMDKRHLRKDGTCTWVRLYVSLVRDAAGEPEYLVAVVESIDARRAAQRQREEALAHTREALRMRDDFLSVAAHELRTPLTPMRLQLEGLLRTLRTGHCESLPNPRFERRLEMAAHQVQRMDLLVSRLLDVSRLQSGGRLDLAREPVDLIELVAAIIQRHRGESERTHTDVRLEADGTLVCRLDRLRIDQVITNLLTNALRFCAGAPVRVAVGQRDGRALVAVIDQGPGIAAVDQGRIFERFERAVSARHFGGLGLGLWIAAELTRAHGGALTVDSEPGKGATFQLELPLT
jgi:PAS domain S-box-containing protein